MAESKNSKLYEGIVSQLLERMQNGSLHPGDRLPSERYLAEELGVSRTAIREALRSLSIMGCIESRVGEGTFVRMPTIDNIVEPATVALTQNAELGSELIETRLILETEIAALAAVRRTDEQLAELEKTLREMEMDIEGGGIGVQADERFHAILAQAAGNHTLSMVLDMCAGMLSRTRPLTQAVKGVPQRTQKDHTAIFEAVLNRDEKTARKWMRAHLNRALKNLSRIK